MVAFEITKKQKILEVNNDICHNYYYLIHGRIYNDEKTKYKKFKYIIWFDIFDIMEYFEKDFITKADITNYLNDLECPYLVNVKTYNDEKGLKEFYSFCNDSIKNYNNIIRGVKNGI